MEKSKTHCVMPHIGMQIQHSGRLSVCNQNPLEFRNSKGTLVQVHKDRLRDSWNAPERQAVKDALDNGVPHANCNGCFDQEAAGQISQRIKLNSAFGNLSASETQPRVLVIKPGNVCNLACRMCSAEASSAWYSDSHKLAVKNQNFNGSLHDYTKQFNNERDGFHLDNVEFWQELREWIPELTFIDIYGGEPFLATGLFNSLSWAAEQGSTANTNLQLSTNLTIYNEKYLNVLSKYKFTYIGMSIDSHLPAQLNYIRYPCDPEQILINLQKFKDYFANHDNVNLGITLTVTPFNLYYLDEIHANLSKYFEFDEFNFVNIPTKYDVRILPRDLKLQIIEKINKPKITDYLLQEVDPTGNYFKIFWQEVKDLDLIRNQSFQATFPEFYDILKPYVQ
jgi:MoaA/NifB/PqqE/SkfB family radical SAM enzyme